MAQCPLSADCFAITCRAVVEGFFAKLIRRRLKYGVFKSVDDLKATIDRFIAEHNKTEAKPFIWKANPDEDMAAQKLGVSNVGINPLGPIFWRAQTGPGVWFPVAR